MRSIEELDSTLEHFDRAAAQSQHTRLAERSPVTSVESQAVDITRGTDPAAGLAPAAAHHQSLVAINHCIMLLQSEE